MGVHGHGSAQGMGGGVLAHMRGVSALFNQKSQILPEILLPFFSGRAMQIGRANGCCRPAESEDESGP